jgi:hypothetical protein
MLSEVLRLCDVCGVTEYFPNMGLTKKDNSLRCMDSTKTPEREGESVSLE